MKKIRFTLETIAVWIGCILVWFMSMFVVSMFESNPSFPLNDLFLVKVALTIIILISAITNSTNSRKYHSSDQFYEQQNQLQQRLFQEQAQRSHDEAVRTHMDFVDHVNHQNFMDSMHHFTDTAIHNHDMNNGGMGMF